MGLFSWSTICLKLQNKASRDMDPSTSRKHDPQLKNSYEE